MFSNTKFINWQKENNTYLKNIFNLIKNNLKKNKIKIKNEDKLKIELINYIYNKNYCGSSLV